jgi:hypothetical protein
MLHWLFKLRVVILLLFLKDYVRGVTVQEKNGTYRAYHLGARVFQHCKGVYLPKYFSRYRIYIGQRITCRTHYETAETYIIGLEEMIYYVEERTHVPSSYKRKKFIATEYSLSDWLTESVTYRYPIGKFVKDLNERLETLDELMLNIEQERPDLYSYYCRVFAPLMSDLPEIMGCLKSAMWGTSRNDGH